MNNQALSILLLLAGMIAIPTWCVAENAGIQTDLENGVGGKWSVHTNDVWEYIAPTVLPNGLTNGTYAIFMAGPHSSAMEQAAGWMQNCQAPFFILGSNDACVVLTYVPRSHPVSQAIVTTLRLEEPKKVSPSESMGESPPR